MLKQALGRGQTVFAHHILAPEGAPPSFERPIDLVHLARQTLGDRALESEVLDLFVVQARAILDQLAREGDLKRRFDLAHTLKGSARSVGAWQVAHEAEACEASMESCAESWNLTLQALRMAIEVAIGAIGGLRQAA
jgi:HPt (histidine-containing phosphotransfer) domain-containing protein